MQTTDATIEMRPLTSGDVDLLRALVTESLSEGFQFLDRFTRAIPTATLNSDHEYFLAASWAGELVAVGGVTPDSYTNNPSIGRVRHVYVRRSHRRRGVASALIRALESRARGVFTTLRLRTDTTSAANFYEHMGYARIADPNATHSRTLVEDLT